VEARLTRAGVSALGRWLCARTYPGKEQPSGMPWAGGAVAQAGAVSRLALPLCAWGASVHSHSLPRG